MVALWSPWLEKNVLQLPLICVWGMNLWGFRRIFKEYAGDVTFFYIDEGLSIVDRFFL